MTRFCFTAVMLLCWWSSLQRLSCTADDLEDFPLDANSNKDADHDYDHETTIDLSAFDRPNSSSDSNDANWNDKAESSAAASAEQRIATFNKIMSAAMKEPSVKPSLGQVLPIIRAMSPTQRLTLATLVLRQLTSPSSSPLPHLEQFSNKSAELMIPISADIAAMLKSLKKNAESGRSTIFGTYYYNPLSAGYRVNNAQHPIFYNIRRRLQASAGNRKSTDDVPPEMMPPPYAPSSNVSYAELNEKIQSHNHHDDRNTDEHNEDYQDDDDNDNDNDDHRGVQHNVSENENTYHESEEYTNETATANGVGNAVEDERCDSPNDDMCYDESYSSYPSENIIKSIKNLERKRIFGALIQDFVHDATSGENNEIQRRLGSVGSAGFGATSSKEKENILQLCASKIKYARPKKAKSTNGNWKFIVNTDHYTQTVRIETCLNSDKSCSFLNENVKSQCVQMFNYHRLLTWDEKSGLSLDLFKIPTCCSCQIQQTNVFSQTTKNTKKPSDVDLQDNVIVDQSNVVYTPPVKPKTKHKFNLTPLPSTPYNSLKRESLWPVKSRRPSVPQQPIILPLQHMDSGGGGVRYPTNENAIRRTSTKTNILKGVHVPGKGTLTEHTAEPENTSTFPRRVNYNYHPIIDFFRSTPSAAANAAAAAQVVDRSDTVADEWLPMTEGPRSIKTR